MKWLEKKTTKGLLKYRMPNIIEAFDLLDLSGVAEGNSNNLKLKKNIIMGMSELVDVSEMEGISTYSDLLNELDLISEISSIADEVIVLAFGAFGKKK